MYSSAKIALALTTSLFFAVGSLTITRAQEPTSTTGPDRFIGVWRLDLEKHPRDGIKSESLKIEKQDKDYKFTYDWIGDRHDEIHWSAVTDMKGGAVKRMQPNGKSLAVVHITRVDAYSFVEQDDMIASTYRVAKDGKTMTMEMKYLHTQGNTAMPKIELVYERTD